MSSPHQTEGRPGTVVIVGAGLAGARCAETLRAEGYDGEVVLVGEEPYAPYERPALSKGFLTGKRDLAEMALHPPSFWSGKRIDLRLNTRVVAIDRQARTATTAEGAELLGRARPGNRRPSATTAAPPSRTASTCCGPRPTRSHCAISSFGEQARRSRRRLRRRRGRFDGQRARGLRHHGLDGTGAVRAPART